MDRKGRFIDFRLTPRRDAKAARAFPKQAIEGVRPYRPVPICADKAPGYRTVIRDLIHRHAPHLDSIPHIGRTWRNNRIEGDHAALKRLLGRRQPFRSLRSAKATILAVETIRTIKNDHISNRARVSAETSTLSEIRPAKQPDSSAGQPLCAQQPPRQQSRRRAR